MTSSYGPRFTTANFISSTEASTPRASSVPALQWAAQMVSAGEIAVLGHMLQLSVSDEMGWTRSKDPFLDNWSAAGVAL